MQHIWETNSCQRCAIQVHERVNIVHLHSLVILFTWKKLQEQKQISYIDLSRGDLDIFSSFGRHSEYLAQFFNAIIWVCCNTSCRHSRVILNNVLESDKLEGAKESS